MCINPYISWRGNEVCLRLCLFNSSDAGVGGNGDPVTFEHRHFSLHGVWDTQIIARSVRELCVLRYAIVCLAEEDCAGTTTLLHCPVTRLKMHCVDPSVNHFLLLSRTR